MSGAKWLVRGARPTKRDRALLASFSCADPAVSWQVEVEAYVRSTLFDWTFDPYASASAPRLLLVFVRSRQQLVGLAAHERITLGYAEQRFAATKLEVVAVARSWQGRCLTTGVRASDVVMSAAMADIAARVPPRHARVLAVIHEENLRSIALCQRHGFTEELSRPDDLPRYRRLVTAHRDDGE